MVAAYEPWNPRACIALRSARAAIVRRDVERALSEDFGSGDVTADLLPAERTRTRA